MARSSTIACLLCTVLFVSIGRAQDRGEPVDRPGDPAAERPVDREGTPPDGDRPRTRLPEVVVTATRTETPSFDAPVSTEVRTASQMQERRLTRSTPEALRDVPSVLVQKTALGQGSPFLRGLTGFHTLFLVDGIRLNNSVFRSGPNQYWATVDPLSVERLELTRGPSSVLYGSDAVGGTVNAVPKEPAFGPGTEWGAVFHGRLSSAENSYTFRAEGSGHVGEEWGFHAGVTTRHFGDLVAGADVGRLPETGYDEWGTDWRVVRRFEGGDELVVGFQRVRQNDVPRTHRTIFAVPWHGTTAGTELRRDLDQTRELAYARLTVRDLAPVADRATFTVSYHGQEQVRDRLRGGGSGFRQDVSGFDVDTAGVSMQFDRATPVGDVTWGVEYTRDEVDSFRRDYVDGALVLREIQGPVGDDASYDLLGAYVQDRVTAGDLEVIPGARLTYAAARADRVDDPLVAGSDPATPGNVISVDEDWTNVVGSLRAVWHAIEDWNVFGGVSQGFRAPNLSDLTAFDATSAVETPSPGLDPESFLAFDLGLKHDGERARGQTAIWTTLLDGMIVQSPTGVWIGGVPEVRKDNVGDGYLWGFEAEGSVRVCGDWSVFGMLSWMDGEVDQFLLPSGVKTTKPVSRLMPLTGIVGLRLDPPDRPWWLEGEVVMADGQDRLALRDRTDTERIPPGGTPGYAVVHLRGGVDVNEHLSVTAAVENATDRDYRIHGSGLNEPGINLIVAATVRV